VVAAVVPQVAESLSRARAPVLAVALRVIAGYRAWLAAHREHFLLTATVADVGRATWNRLEDRLKGGRAITARGYSRRR
jgi:hypothetical protein